MPEIVPSPPIVHKGNLLITGYIYSSIL